MPDTYQYKVRDRQGKLLEGSLEADSTTLVRQGQITQKLAEARSSTPEELGRLLGAGSLAAA